MRALLLVDLYTGSQWGAHPAHSKAEQDRAGNGVIVSGDGSLSDILESKLTRHSATRCKRHLEEKVRALRRDVLDDISCQSCLGSKAINIVIPHGAGCRTKKKRRFEDSLMSHADWFWESP